MTDKKITRAILSDITTPKNRSKALAHVGIAFAVCFILGPPIGAYFSSNPMPLPFGTALPELNIYATPAILTLILLSAETAFLAIALPETRGKAPIKSRKGSPAKENGINGHGENGHSVNGHGNHSNHDSKSSKRNPQSDITRRLKALSSLKTVHCAFLGIFSGVEFTLTFLTFDCQSPFNSLF